MDEQGQGDELYPIAVLIDELKVRRQPTHTFQPERENYLLTAATA